MTLHQPPQSKTPVQPTVSAVLRDGTLVETLYRPDEERTLFCIAKDGEMRYETSLTVAGERLVPYSPRNNLLTNEIVLLPSEPEAYTSEQELLTDIQMFLHRYVDVSPLFERVASYYVLLSWLYDAFDELPYLRLRGAPGSGKSRFLRVVGSVCYKPMFASAASTVSPLFRMLHEIRGTLIVDEADFRLSDERAEIVKILNNGNGRGFPVLRTETVGKEFLPRAYVVFGPKLVATRGFFDDLALESRCLTEEMGQGTLRDDIPLRLPPSFRGEALALRNQLLLFRVRNRGKQFATDQLVDRGIEPRLNQIFLPLLSVIEDPTARRDLLGLARRFHAELIADRGAGVEAQVLEVIRDQLKAGERLGIKELASWFADRHSEEYERKITPLWIGSIIRKRLQLKSQRGHGGGYVIPISEEPKLKRLFVKYGLDDASEEATSSPPSTSAGNGSGELGELGELRPEGTPTLWP